MLKLYAIARSRGFRNIWMLEEGQVPYELVPVGFDDGPTGVRSDWFATINPARRIPVLVDGDLVLSESLAINLYLARNYVPALYPSTPAGEAAAWQWTLFTATEVERPAGLINYHRWLWAPERRSPDTAASAEVELRPRLDVLDRHLAGRQHLLGDDFCVADLNTAAVLYPIWRNGFDFSAWPHLSAWLARVLERPAALAARKLRE